MPVDAYWAVAAAVGWIFGLIMAAYALGQATQLRDLRNLTARFDHDGDGKPGGSLPR